jgi:hypothetical protein
MIVACATHSASHCSNVQRTSIYGQKGLCVFGNAIPESTLTQSEQTRLLSNFDCEQQDQLAHVVYPTNVFRTTACRCRMAVA